MTKKIFCFYFNLILVENKIHLAVIYFIYCKRKATSKAVFANKPSASIYLGIMIT